MAGMEICKPGGENHLETFCSVKTVTNKKVVLSMQEIFYYIFFVCLLFAKGIGLYEGMPAFNLCIVLSLFAIGMKFLITEYTLAEWSGIAAIMLCSVIAYSLTGEKATIITCLTVLGIKNIPLKRLLKIAFAVWSVTFYGMMLVHLMGWKEEIVLAHNKFGLGFILRHSLGYPHPNVLHISFVIWMALLFYLVSMNKKQLIIASVCLFMENIFIFVYSVSITGFLLATLYLFLNFYFAVRGKLHSVEKLIVRCILPLCILISVIPPLFFEGKIYDMVNKLLNTRLKIWRYYLSTFIPGAFGTAVWSPTDEILSLDNSYLYLLYYYGIILFVLIMCLFEYTIWKYTKENQKKELAVILGMLIAGITEPYLFNFSYKNIILLFAGSELFKVLEKSGGRKITILPKGNRKIEVQSAGYVVITKIKDVICGLKRKEKAFLFICGIVMGVFFSIMAGTVYQNPDTIYVRNDQCDYVRGDGITFDEIPNLENSLIFGYIDNETRFYGFEGNMIMVEWLRFCLSGAVFGFIAGAVLFLGVICYNQLVLSEKRKAI